MIVYKFYLRDSKNGDTFLGTLPERRRNPKRITDESVINWGRRYFGVNGNGEKIYFMKIFLDEVEKRCLNFSNKLKEKTLRSQSSQNPAPK